jgi:hypothetical protein
MIQFPSKTEPLDFNTIQVQLTNLFNIDVPYGLNDDEEQAYIKAHLIQQIKATIKTNNVQFDQLIWES